MILISHRGNTKGKDISLENNPSYVLTTIDKGFDVEIDLWVINNELFLGHDEPSYRISMEWLESYQEKLWLHCKNLDCVSFLYDYKFNYFWHENDKVTLTSHGFIWAYPGLQKIKNSISVLPELFNDDISDCIGVCSDYIINYR